MFIKRRKNGITMFPSKLTTSQEARDIIISRAANKGRRPGELHHESYFAANRTEDFSLENWIMFLPVVFILCEAQQ